MELELKRVEGRWKGTIDLDPEAVGAMTLDGMVFFVVAVRVEQMGATRITKDGEAVRKDILDVTDARVMLGDARQQAVEFLAAREDDPVSLQDSLGPNTGSRAPTAKANDRSDGMSEPEPEPEPRAPDPDDRVGVVGSIHKKKSSAGEGKANVGKFASSDEDVTAETVRVVGDGRSYRDPALARFMEGGQ